MWFPIIIAGAVVFVSVRLAVELLRGGTSSVRKLVGTSTPSLPSQSGPLTVSNGMMVSSAGARYQITDTDLLWLARSVLGEAGTNGENGRAVIWALAQNYMLVGANPPRMTSFTGLIRAYSQPVNPNWSSMSASGCQRNPSACTATLLARRQRISTTPWDSIPQSIRTLVQDFYRGMLSNPIPGMVDFAPGDWQGARVSIGGNNFGVGQNRQLTV